MNVMKNNGGLLVAKIIFYLPVPSIIFIARTICSTYIQLFINLDRFGDFIFETFFAQLKLKKKRSNEQSHQTLQSFFKFNSQQIMDNFHCAHNNKMLTKISDLIVEWMFGAKNC